MVDPLNEEQPFFISEEIKVGRESLVFNRPSSCPYGSKPPSSNQLNVLMMAMGEDKNQWDARIPNIKSNKTPYLWSSIYRLPW